MVYTFCQCPLPLSVTGSEDAPPSGPSPSPFPRHGHALPVWCWRIVTLYRLCTRFACNDRVLNTGFSHNSPANQRKTFPAHVSGIPQRSPTLSKASTVEIRGLDAPFEGNVARPEYECILELPRQLDQRLAKLLALTRSHYST
jgi:hypothetical protein